MYRARDSRLQREVAIKILPDAFAADPDRLARFQREAQVLASLNHTNIAAIYGFEEKALILELVEGPTLADRMAQGPIPFEDALPVARQIAEALEAAHEHGIIHRDLKPSNIKLRPDGAVKVLDFGLAKALDAGGTGPMAVMSMSPTITSPAATGLGVILGTAAYMSPEQAKGKRTDQRADIWALGCVLYEMLTGRRAFAGEEISETLAEVIKGEPDWKALPTDTPPSIRRLLRRCLVKDPRSRIADAGMVRIEIDEALTPSDPAIPVAPAPRRTLRLVLAIAAVTLAAWTALGIWAISRRPNTAPAEAMQFAIHLPPGARLYSAANQRMAVSADGRRLAFVVTEGGRSSLYARSLDELDARPVTGVDSRVGSIFFSPDGNWIAYNDTTTGAFRKVPFAGGPSANIIEARAASGGFRGATWSRSGRIVFATVAAPGLMQVLDAGGVPEPVTMPDGEVHMDPHVLPDGETVLFAIQRAGMPDRIAVTSLRTREQRVLIPGRSPKFTASGYLVFQREGAVWAVAFDPRRLEVIGTPIPVLEGVTMGVVGRAAFDVAHSGSLIYSPAGTTTVPRTLVWVDRQGHEEPLPVPMRAYLYPQLSPDGTKLAVDVRDEDNDVWIWDLVRSSLRRFTFDRAIDGAPVWSPDGTRLVFSSNRGTTARGANIFSQAADGTGAVQQLTTGTTSTKYAAAFTPDGRRLVFSDEGAATTTLADLMVMPLDGERKPETLLQTEFREFNAALSPDGKWIAYQVRESSRYEVYVRPFPEVQRGRWQISTDGGEQPLWSRDGREIFYLNPEGKLMSVSVQTTPTFVAQTPRPVFDKSYVFDITANSLRTYDVSRDGRRFLMIKNVELPEQAAVPQVVLILNWSEELKRRLPSN